MIKEYRKSLEIFEEIYFDKDGNLDKTNWGAGLDKLDKEDYLEKGYHNFMRISNIRGRSAFTPRIIFRPSNEGCYDGNGKFFLTIEKGLFSLQLTDYFYKANNIREIDITDWSKEEIMEEVKKILNFSNEEIMRQFNVKDLGSPFETTALLIDDVVQNYFEDNDYKYRQGLYWEESITRNAKKKCENRIEREIQVDCKPEDRYESWQIIVVKEFMIDSDKEYYTEKKIIFEIITPETMSDIGNIQVRIKETEGKSELLDRVIDMLETKFANRQNEIYIGEPRIEISLDSVGKKKVDSLTPHEAFLQTLKKKDETSDFMDALMERMMQILRGYRGKNENGQSSTDDDNKNGQSSTNDDNKNTYRINDIAPVR